MILIIDDEQDILELLEDYLGPLKKEVHRATSVPEALKLLQKNTYQLVVSDIVLKSGRGNSILSYMRQKGGPHCATPVVLISGFVKNIDKNEMDDLTRFLAKPFSQDDLIETIKELFPKKESNSLHPTLKKLISGN